MKQNYLVAISAVALAAFGLSSCDTPVGQGAGFGAATGAIIGGAATGHVRGAAVGAAIGAGTGALIGAAVEADQRGYYGGRPMSDLPYARFSGSPGIVISPYPPHNLVDVRGIPRGAVVRDTSTGGYFRKP